MLKLTDSKFNCSNTTCLPFTIVIVSNIRQCQIVCLAQIQCQALSYEQSNCKCQLFTDILNQTDYMLFDVNIVTMIVQSDTRIPTVVESMTTTTTTQASTTAITSYLTSTSTTSTCVSTITPAGRAPTIGWDFEGNLNDRFGIYNGTSRNTTTYQLGRHGCGKCLNLTSSLNQSVYVYGTPYIDLRSISFSVETWIKPTIATDGLEHVIFSQCGSLGSYQCMRCAIGNPGPMTFRFRSDTQTGSQNISINVWSHLAYVYNMTAGTMTLYLNGTLDKTAAGHGPYTGSPTFFQIGNVDSIGGIYYEGCIDEIFFYPFIRTASEIAATFALG